MIKINLLESVTDRQPGAAKVVEKKVSSPLTKLLLMAFAVTALLIALIGWDVVDSNMAKAEAEKERDRQKEIATQLEAVTKEQKELEQKIANIDTRIEAIKKLKANQAGPKNVLDAVRERVARFPGLFLDSIEQKGDLVTIIGKSPEDKSVTEFSQSLELFSDGLFKNITINMKTQEVAQPVPVGTAVVGEAPKLIFHTFEIKATYDPSKTGKSTQTTTATGPQAASPQTVQNATTAANPAPAASPQPQVAKN